MLVLSWYPSSSARGQLCQRTLYIRACAPNNFIFETPVDFFYFAVEPACLLSVSWYFRSCVVVVLRIVVLFPLSNYFSVTRASFLSNVTIWSCTATAREMQPMCTSIEHWPAPIDTSCAPPDLYCCVAMASIDANREQAVRSGLSRAGALITQPPSSRTRGWARREEFQGSQRRIVWDVTEPRRNCREKCVFEKASNASEVDNLPPLREDVEVPFCGKLVEPRK